MKLSRSIHSIIHTIPIGHKVIVDDSDALIYLFYFLPSALSYGTPPIVDECVSGFWAAVFWAVALVQV